MIVRWYYWLWHDFLHLDKPISWLIVDSVRAHLLIWQLTGSITLAVIWTLLMHFIAMK